MSQRGWVSAAMGQSGASRARR